MREVRVLPEDPIGDGGFHSAEELWNHIKSVSPSQGVHLLVYRTDFGVCPDCKEQGVPALWPQEELPLLEPTGERLCEAHWEYAMQQFYRPDPGWPMEDKK